MIVSVKIELKTSIIHLHFLLKLRWLNTLVVKCLLGHPVYAFNLSYEENGILIWVDLILMEKVNLKKIECFYHEVIMRKIVEIGKATFTISRVIKLIATIIYTKS